MKLAKDIFPSLMPKQFSREYILANAGIVALNGINLDGFLYFTQDFLSERAYFWRLSDDTSNKLMMLNRKKNIPQFAYHLKPIRRDEFLSHLTDPNSHFSLDFYGFEVEGKVNEILVLNTSKSRVEFKSFKSTGEISYIVEDKELEENLKEPRTSSSIAGFSVNQILFNPRSNNGEFKSEIVTTVLTELLKLYR